RNSRGQRDGDVRRPPSHRLKIVRKILRRDQPLIGTILRIAGDHVTRLRRSSLFICLRNADAAYILARLIRAKFCDLFASILPKFAHSFLRGLEENVLPGCSVPVRGTPDSLHIISSDCDYRGAEQGEHVRSPLVLRERAFALELSSH